MITPTDHKNVFVSSPLILLIGILLLLSMSVLAEPVPLKILSWNIQMLPVPASVTKVTQDLDKKQALRAPWIMDFLCGQDYDIIVLQEVIDRTITDQLKEGLKAAFPYIVAPAPDSGVAGASGGILIAGKLPLRHVTTIAFENVTGVDALARKGCTLVEAEKDGVTFQLAGTHLQAGHQDLKEKEFVELYEKIIKPYQREGIPQFLAGDMNTGRRSDPGEDKLELLLKTTDMQVFPVDDERPYTIDNTNSWHGPDKQPALIDHILLNPRGTSTTIRRQTIQRARTDSEGQPMDLSDHYGIVAEILLNP